MATQLKHTDFAYTPAPTPRPNIRVAFIAGEATAAVHDAMAKLPADTRDGTLDDLVWDQGVAAVEDVTLIQSMTCALIEKAQDFYLWPVFTLSKEGKWATDRVMLLGDAAVSLFSSSSSLYHYGAPSV